MAQFPFKEAVLRILTSEEVSYGTQLGIFFDDLRDLISRLPIIVRESSPSLTYASIRRAKPLPFPPDEPQGLLLDYPIPRFGLRILEEINESSRSLELKALYPFASEGVQHGLTLEGILLWPSRLEAQLVCSTLPDAQIELTFFDPNFVANRVFYRKGDIFQFILSGYAYRFSVIEAKPIFWKDPDLIRALRGDHSESPEGEPIRIETKGMAALLPREDISPDSYEFQGPVKKVEELHRDMLGQRTWKVRVTVNRLVDSKEADVDFDICVYVPERVLGGSKVPESGDDVCGTIWLQGYLWYPGR